MEFSNEKSGAFLVLTVSGRMDTLTAPEFDAEAARLIAAGEKRFVVDFTRLDYISSAGLRSILAAAKKLKAVGGDIALCGISGLVSEVFTVSGFTKLLPIFATPAEAVARG